MKNTIILLCTICLFSCKQNHNSKQFWLFLGRYSECHQKVYVWVNDQPIYSGKFVYGYKSKIPNLMHVDDLDQNHITQFHIRTAKKDTFFTYKTDTIEDLYIWLPCCENEKYEIYDNKTRRNKDDVGIE